MSDEEGSSVQNFASWRGVPKSTGAKWAHLERELADTHAEHVAKGKAFEYWLQRELESGAQVPAGKINQDFQLHSTDHIDLQRRNYRHPEGPDIATGRLIFLSRDGKVTAGFDLEGYLVLPDIKSGVLVLLV